MYFRRAKVSWAVTLGALAWALLVPIDAAWAERLPVRSYGLADGLPSTFIEHIVSDSRGLLWFSTRDGLARFDGARFVTYGIDDGLPVPTVNFLLETPSHTYWVATNGGGICRMDTGVVTRVTAQAAASQQQARTLFQCLSLGGGAADLVNVLQEDLNGRIWIGTDGGLFRLDVRANGRGQPVKIDLQAVWGDQRPVRVVALLTGTDGDMWVGTHDGLLRVLGDDRPQLYQMPATIATPTVRQIARGADGHIWVAYVSGLLRICATAPTGILTEQRGGTSPSAGCMTPQWIPLENEQIGATALLASADGRIWIGTDRGLLEFDGRRFRRYQTSHGVPEQGVRALAEDRDGNLWIASLSAVTKLRLNGFLTYGEHDGLTAARITALYEDAHGQVFAVGGRWTVSRFDGTRFVSVQPRVPPGLPPWGSQGAFLDRHNGWWIVGQASLGRYPVANRIEQMSGRPALLVYPERRQVDGQRFLRLFEDVRGDIWWSAFGANGELGRWDRQNQAFVRYPDVHGRVRGDWATAFGEDASGNLWIGFNLGGLVRYDGSRFELLSGDGVPGGSITSIHRDTSGRLWIGSSSDGLTRVDDATAERPRFVRYTTKEGLSTRNVRCITSDALGRIYVGTARGVDRIDPRSGLVRRYTTGDGLANGFVTTALHDSSGRLWFGTMDGLSRLVTVPEQPAVAPTTWIEEWRVNGASQPVSLLGHGSISGIVLQPNQTEVEIEFSAVEFREASALRYQYRLEGAGGDWSRPAAERLVRYSRLAPGRYQFQVRAITADGVPGSTPASMSFVILPPVSQRAWFRGSVLLGLMLIVLAAHRYRVARLLALERVRMRIAADLHDDIGGSLSRISIQSEVACREAAGLGEQPGRRLVEIADSARGLVDALGDVVWSVDPRRDDLASVCRRIREYADDLLPGSGVRWRYAASAKLESVKLDPQARRDLYLLLKEAVTNVARHASARSVVLNVELTNRELHAELQDDGCGFNPSAFDREDQSDHDGLASMRARAERLGARLTIESSPGIGTTLRLRMPILRRWGRMNMLLFRRLRR
jgi:ligand-binding sensor domain-containing protein/signal transduction histidine kinase